MPARNPFTKEPETEDGANERVSSAGVPPAIFPQHDPHIKIRSRGRLPHWEAIGATYFVTFRLADSLPQDALQRIRFARQDILATAARVGREISGSERTRLTNCAPAGSKNIWMLGLEHAFCGIRLWPKWLRGHWDNSMASGIVCSLGA
jgi:hypothetical protein